MIFNNVDVIFELPGQFLSQIWDHFYHNIWSKSTVLRAYFDNFCTLTSQPSSVVQEIRFYEWETKGET